MTTSSWVIEQMGAESEAAPATCADRGWPRSRTVLFVVGSSGALWAIIIALLSLMLG